MTISRSLLNETARLAAEAMYRPITAGGGGGGITQLTGDVLAGPGSGAVSSTVVRVNGATVPVSGALVTGNGLYVTGASALTYSALNLAGGAGYVTGLLPVTNIAPAGTNTFVLTTVGGVTTWAAASGGSGITQLTGDGTAGPGSGSQALTVVRINGATVPAAGALTTGNGLYVTGASALTYSALNLAGGSGYVTGLLPVANIAPSGTNNFVLTTVGGATVWAASTGSGGITQLTGDVTAGPGTGSVAATVVRINGATVPASGALTTGNGLYVTGASALTYSALNLAGGAGYVTGLLPVTNIAPAGTNTFVLTTVGGVTTWAAASGGSGITQLTGDGTAGPGSGSQALTVVRINGATVPAAGALTTGNGLYVTGASALTYSALNLAGGAGYVTGLLPVTNIAPAGTNTFVLTTVGGVTTWAAASGGSGITALTNDVTASGTGSVSATVNAIGNQSILYSGGALQWIAGLGAPGLSQATTTGTPAAFTITPQTTVEAGEPGGILLANLAPPTSGGTEGYFGVERNGTITNAIGFQAGGASGFLSLGLGGTAPTYTGAAIAGSAGITYLNSTAQIFFAYSLVNINLTANMSGIQLFNGSTTDFGSGVGVLSLGTVSTFPTVTPTSSLILAEGGTALFAYQHSTFFTSQTILPVWTGTQNTQAGSIHSYAGVCRTTSATGVIILAIPLATSGQGVGFACRLCGRNTSTGATVAIFQVLDFENIGGTVTQSTTVAAASISGDATMTGSSIGVVISGTTIELLATPGLGTGAVSIDWTGYIDAAIFN